MKVLLLSLLGFVNQIVWGQSQISDTTVIIGFTQVETYLHDKLGAACVGDYKQKISPHIPLVVYGTYKCKGYNSENNYFIVLYNKKKLYCDRYNLRLDKSVFDQIEDFGQGQLASFQSRAAQYDSLLTSETAEKLEKAAKEKSKKLLLELKTKEKNGLILLKYGPYDQSQYTSGTGFQIKFYNTSQKTIKYLWFSVTGVNPVGDKVSTKELKGVGPVEKGKLGAYDFEYAWLTDLVETVRLNSIKIQYMDGTYKTITNISMIIVSQDLLDYIESSDY